MTTKTSKAGGAFIAAFEGVELKAYPDPGTGGDPWTIGVGHTAAAGPRPFTKA
jgi:lysozyme